MELTEDEKKIIDDLKYIKTKSSGSTMICEKSDIEAFLNLIEKQQKEIERLKYGRNFLFDNIRTRNWTPEMFNRLVEEKYIPKEAIREKIKSLEQEKEQLRTDKGVLWDSGIYKLDLKIEIYKELLGE